MRVFERDKGSKKNEKTLRLDGYMEKEKKKERVSHFVFLIGDPLRKTGTRTHCNALNTVKYARESPSSPPPCYKMKKKEKRNCTDVPAAS